MKKVVMVTWLIAFAAMLFASGDKEAVPDDVPFAGREVTLTLVMEGNAEQQEWMRSLKEDFTKEYPNITVNDVWISVGSGGWGSYFTKVKTMIAGGDAPDVVRVAVEGFQLLHEDNLALPLNEYFESHPEFVEDYDDIHPKLQDACIIDGSIYGFGWDWNNVVTHINTDMLREAGLPMPGPDWDKNEFLQYAKALTTEKGGQKTYGVMVPNYYFGLEAWLYAFGAAFLNDEMTEGALTTPESKEAFQFLHDLIYVHEVSPVPVPGDNFISMMTNRQVAMVFGGRWPVVSFMDADLNFDVQYLPLFQQRQVIFGVGIFPVMSASKYPEEAYVLSAWLSGKYAQRTFLQTWAIPTRKSVMDEVLPTAPPANSALYRESADTARVVQSPARYPEVQKVIDRMFNAMVADPQADIDRYLADANEELNDILSR